MADQIKNVAVRCQSAVMSMRTLFRKHCTFHGESGSGRPVRRTRVTSSLLYASEKASNFNYGYTWLKTKILDKYCTEDDSDTVHCLLEFLTTFNNYGETASGSESVKIADEIIENLQQEQFDSDKIGEMADKLCELLDDQGEVVGEKSALFAATPAARPTKRSVENGPITLSKQRKVDGDPCPKSIHPPEFPEDNLEDHLVAPAPVYENISPASSRPTSRPHSRSSFLDSELKPILSQAGLDRKVFTARRRMCDVVAAEDSQRASAPPEPATFSAPCVQDPEERISPVVCVTKVPDNAESQGRDTPENSVLISALEAVCNRTKPLKLQLPRFMVDSSSKAAESAGAGHTFTLREEAHGSKDKDKTSRRNSLRKRDRDQTLDSEDAPEDSGEDKTYVPEKSAEKKRGRKKKRGDPAPPTRKSSRQKKPEAPKSRREAAGASVDKANEEANEEALGAGDDKDEKVEDLNEDAKSEPEDSTTEAAGVDTPKTKITPKWEMTDKRVVSYVMRKLATDAANRADRQNERAKKQAEKEAAGLVKSPKVRSRKKSEKPVETTPSSQSFASPSTNSAFDISAESLVSNSPELVALNTDDLMEVCQLQPLSSQLPLFAPTVPPPEARPNSRRSGISEEEVRSSVDNLMLEMDPQLPGQQGSITAMPLVPAPKQRAISHTLPGHAHHVPIPGPAETLHHHLPGNNSCNKCGVAYRTTKELESHERTWHKETHVCSACDSKFDSKRMLDVHLKTKAHGQAISILERVAEMISFSVRPEGVNTSALPPLSCITREESSNAHIRGFPPIAKILNHLSNVVGATSGDSSVEFHGTQGDREVHVSPPIWENGSAQAPASVPPAQNTGHPYSVQSLPSVPPTPSSAISTPRYHYSPSPRSVVESGSPWTAPAQGGYGMYRPPAQPQGQPMYEQHSMPSQGVPVPPAPPSHRPATQGMYDQYTQLRPVVPPSPHYYNHNQMSPQMWYNPAAPQHQQYPPVQYEDAPQFYNL